MIWPLIGVSDLDAESVEILLRRAETYRALGRDRPKPTPATLALLFYEASLRTRVGFSSAAHRLGISTVEVYEPRASDTSMPENWGDTLRTVAGYADVIVARPGFALDSNQTARTCRAFINGGDSGLRAQHPSQALIDLYALRVLTDRTPLVVVMWGDPRMRAARSLMMLLEMVSDTEVYLVTDQRFLDDWDPPASHSMRVIQQADLASVAPDVLYVVGMPHATLPLDRRANLIVTADTLDELPSDAVVLCPLPVIDELADSARLDPRVKMFEQSDLGLYMRMSLLTAALQADQAHA